MSDLFRACASALLLMMDASRAPMVHRSLEHSQHNSAQHASTDERQAASLSASAPQARAEDIGTVDQVE